MASFSLMHKPFDVTLLPVEPEPYNAMVRAGLFELRAADLVRIKCAYEARPPTPDGWRPSIDERMILNHDDLPRPIRLCFDLDDTHAIHPEVLEETDVYIKRGYIQETVDAQPDGLRHKIIPFGYHYACRSRHETTRDILLESVASQRIRGNLLTRPTRTARAVAKHLIRPQSLPPLIDEFEAAPSKPVIEKVFFRTRVYAPHEAVGAHRDGQLEHINGMRSAVVRALKSAFGDRFVGGLRSSSFALANYPDCVMDTDYGHTEHLKQSQAYLINVSTSGLHGSTGWKLPEFLAASSCIVCERMHHDVPDPLVDGFHYFAFDEPEQCVSACETLLSDPELAGEMRQRNHAYYTQHVRPDRVILSCLERATQIYAV